MNEEQSAQLFLWLINSSDSTCSGTLNSCSAFQPGARPPRLIVTNKCVSVFASAWRLVPGVAGKDRCLCYGPVPTRPVSPSACWCFDENQSWLIDVSLRAKKMIFTASASAFLVLFHCTASMRTWKALLFLETKVSCRFIWMISRRNLQTVSNRAIWTKKERLTSRLQGKAVQLSSTMTLFNWFDSLKPKTKCSLRYPEHLFEFTEVYYPL